MSGVEVTSRQYTPGNHSSYSPVTLHNVELEQKRAKVCFGDQEVILEGKGSIQLANGEKYGKEIVFQNFSSEHVQKSRCNESKWDRSEIFFHASDIPRLIEALETLQRKAESEWGGLE